MAHLISLSIDATKITKARMKDGKYINITVNISDEVDKYGNNVSAWENQTLDERKSKAKRTYVGNGRVLFTEGGVFKPGKQEESSNDNSEDLSEMPF